MVCVYCAGPTRVTNSRLQRRINNIWRRRLCSHCAASFTTLEKADLSNSFMVQINTTTLEPFLKEKLFLSIYRSCGHRSTAIRDAAALTDTVIANLPFPAAQSIEAKDIARVTYKVLLRFDGIAATFYKAYHL